MSEMKIPETLDEALAEIRRLRAELSRTKGQLTRAWADRKRIHGDLEREIRNKNKESR